MRHRRNFPFTGKVLLFACLLIGLPGLLPRLLAAGDLTLKGIVQSERGEPLTDATVTATNTRTKKSISSISNEKGFFSLANLDKGATYDIAFSHTGYETSLVKGYTITEKSESALMIRLKESHNILDQVVVVGYGSQNSRYLTGAVSSVKSAALEQYPATSVEQALSGKVPGVQFLSSSGQPGAGFSVRVRGVTSIAGGNEPLYVIDGVPFFNNDVRNFNGLSSINPSDIESIDVLKDAAATAIYGSRGGNGVIMITTRSGKAGNPMLQYDTWVGWNEPRKKLDLMDATGFKTYLQSFYKNSGLALPSDFSKIKNNNTDWQDQLLQKSFRQSHTLALSGGSDRGHYYVSLNYADENGIVLNSNFKRYSFSTRVENKINELFSIQSSVTAAHTEQNGLYPADNSNTLSITKTGIGSMLLALPTEPVYDSSGHYSNIFPYSFSSQLENPVAYAKAAVNRYTDNRVFSSVMLTTTFSGSLVNRTRVGINYLDRRNDTYFPKIFQVLYPGLGYALLDSRSDLDWVAENFTEYRHRILPRLDLDVLAGGSLEQENYKSFHIEGQGFISDALQNNAIQAATTILNPQTYLYQRSLASLFGRAIFDYDQRYILEGNIRRDGASVFSVGNKIATFPSVAASWVLNKESFFEGQHLFSSAKLRASWGQSGNQAIQPYQSLNVGSLVTTTQNGGMLSVGLIPDLPNTKITWETTTQMNYGIDLGLAGNRLQLIADYYRKRTAGALSTVQLPPSSGFSTLTDNVGTVENKGFEVGLQAELLNGGPWRLSVGANISSNNNRVVATKNNQSIYDILASSDYGGVTPVSGYSAIIPGQPLGVITGFRFTGFDGKGIPQYLDVDKNGVIDAKDLVILGSPFPHYLYGANIQLNYKKLGLVLNWQGVAGARLFDLDMYNLTLPIAGFNRAKSIYSYFPVPGQSLVPRPSNQYLEDAGFLRLKNIRLDYDCRVGKLKKLTFYVSAQNLFTFTRYKGYDPEVNSFNGSDLKQGFDNAAYPSAKSFLFGVSLQY